MVIRRSEKPQCFDGLNGQDYGIDDTFYNRAWMRCEVSFPWLHKFEDYISKDCNRKVLLLIDNASSHSTHETLLYIPHVQVVRLPASAISRLETLDAGVIASVKKRYMRGQIERAVDLLDLCVAENMYDIDLLRFPMMIYDTWNIHDF